MMQRIINYYILNCIYKKLKNYFYRELIKIIDIWWCYERYIISLSLQQSNLKQKNWFSTILQDPAPPKNRVQTRHKTVDLIFGLPQVKERRNVNDDIFPCPKSYCRMRNWVESTTSQWCLNLFQINTKITIKINF